MNVFERKYCIMDNSGNYYTVNEYDALVVAEDEQTAEWFDILEANKRINNSGMAKSLRTVAANKSMCVSKKKSSVEKTENWLDDSNSEFVMEEIDLSLLAKGMI